MKILNLTLDGILNNYIIITMTISDIMIHDVTRSNMDEFHIVVESQLVLINVFSRRGWHVILGSSCCKYSSVYKLW